MIEVGGLSVCLGGATILEGVGFTVPAKQGLALWGANGAGKTTVLRAMLGLVPFRGEISIAGSDVRRAGECARRLVGHVPQQVALWDEMSALECLSFVSRLRGAPVRTAGALLDSVGLAAAKAKSVRSLSGGMRQRLALAVALVGDPPVLLLDEPTASLDPAGRASFLALLKELRAAGKTLVVTSHRLSEVQVLAEHAVVLEAGRVALTCQAPALRTALAASEV